MKSRQYNRNPGPYAKTPVLFLISCLASLYVVGRLWASNSEIAHLRDNLEALTTLAQSQQASLEAAQDTALVGSEEPYFYSVRPDPPKIIPPLTGSILNQSLIIPDTPLPTQPETQTETPLDNDSSETEVNDSDKYNASIVSKVVADIDLIENGVVSGWACSRTKDITGPLKLSIYIDRIMVAQVTATERIDLPAAVKSLCKLEGQAPGAEPAGFKASFPALQPGTHSLRAFIDLPDGFKIEAHHSPAYFIESPIKPDGMEALRRKDAIILRRNAELVSIMEEVKTQIPWKKAEAAALAEEERLHNPTYRDEEANRLLVVVLAHSDPQDKEQRALDRATWAPANPTEAQQIRTTLKVAVRFIMSAPTGAIADSVNDELKEFKDIIIVDEDGAVDSDAKIMLGALATATLDSDLDAAYYVITRDKVVVDLEAMVSNLEDVKLPKNAYIGCLKSGEIIKGSSNWAEPKHERFGRAEGKDASLFYPLHAQKEFYAMSRHIARYLARSRSILETYEFEDTSMGAWMLGINVSHQDEGNFCCDSSKYCSDSKKKMASKTGPRCVAYWEPSCQGVCNPKERIPTIYSNCVEKN